MRGRFALGAEVIHRAHETFAEALLPEAIHRHARGQRILRRDDPAREAEPIARCRFEPRSNGCGHAGRHGLPWLVVLAAREDVRGPGFLHLLHDQHGGDGGPEIAFCQLGCFHQLPRGTKRGLGKTVRVVIEQQLGFLRAAFRGGHFENAAHALAPEPIGNLQLLHRPLKQTHFVELTIVTQPGIPAAETQRFRIRNAAIERVAPHFDRGKRPIHEDAQTRCLT